MTRAKHIDRFFLLIVAVLSVGGYAIFLSASLGLFSEGRGEFGLAATKQFVLGLVLGSILLTAFARIPYRFWRRYAFYFFLFALSLTAAVLIPGIGQSHGGATRWLDIFGFSFQPAELLKLAFVVYLAAWFSGVREKVADIRLGLLPFAVLSALAALVLLAQPDTDALLILLISGGAIYLVAGAPLRHLAILALIGTIGAGVLFTQQSYLASRLATFLKPGTDALGAGYQVNQSLIAIGSGGILGRGFGQSLQKFDYLPEPTGDSIFAVAGEEFGFVGASILVAAFLLFALRGLRIAKHSPDTFGRLLGVGIICLITVQSFINIASMLGLFPLSGTPLIFVSQGGSSLSLALAEVGILLSISKAAS